MPPSYFASLSARTAAPRSPARSIAGGATLSAGWTPFSVADGAPSWAFLGLEPLRAAFEYASTRMMDTTSLPPGDGHPVVIFPGLAADRHSVGPLKSFCEQLGYTAYDWGRGLNTGPQGNVDEWIDELARHVRQLTSSHREQVSLIGWSLGGIYAREVAKILKGRVRQVITIGTPFAGKAEQNNVTWVYRSLSSQAPSLDDALMIRLRTAPDVPTTSIYSRSDGVVAWQACLHDDDCGHAENVEVDGSHCGLGWNSEVWSVIADRLRQSQRTWRRHAGTRQSAEV